MEVVVNYWAVIVCAVISAVLGSLWYGPLFGKAWMKEVGFTDADKEKAKADPSIKRQMMRSYILVLVGAFVMTYVLAHVLTFAMAFTGMEGVSAGLTAGAWCWLGFTAPALLGPVLWENRSWRYWFITAGYYLVFLLIAGAILASWPA